MELDDSVTALLIPCIVVKEPAPGGGLSTPDLRQKLVRLTGLEPVTLRLSSACSNQLSYRRPTGAGGAEEARTPDL